MKVEVSNPHFHPARYSQTEHFTKKRDLSVPPHWVANERVEKDGKSYAVVMPPRDKELYEERQDVHIHIPLYTKIKIGDKEFMAKVKVVEGYGFGPVVHFDNVEADENGIKGGEEAII